MTLEQLLKSVGARIAQLRAKRHLTQKTLSEKTGVTYRYLQTIESGRANVTLGTLHRLASFLHVKVPDLVAVGSGQGPGIKMDAMASALESGERVNGD